MIRLLPQYFCTEIVPITANGELQNPHPCFRLVAKTSAACIFRYTVFPTRIDKPYKHRSRKENIFTFGIFLHFFLSKAIEPVNGHISISDLFFFYLFYFNPKKKKLTFSPCKLANLFSPLCSLKLALIQSIKISQIFPPRHWMDPCSCDYIRRSVYVS